MACHGMEQGGPIEADDDKATRHPGEFAEDTLSFGGAIAVVQQADTQHTVKYAISKGQRQDVGTQPELPAMLCVVGRRQVRHIITDISPNGCDPKTSIQRRKPAIAAGNIQHSAVGQLALREQLGQNTLLTPVDPRLIQRPIPLLLIVLRVVSYAAGDVLTHLSCSYVHHRWPIETYSIP